MNQPRTTQKGAEMTEHVEHWTGERMVKEIERLRAEEMRLQAENAYLEDELEEYKSTAISNSIDRHYTYMEWKERAEKAEAERDKAMSELKPELERLRAKNSELREALNECADDLQTELEHRYGYPSIHPAMQRKFDRDMAPVERARALLTRTAKD